MGENLSGGGLKVWLLMGFFSLLDLCMVIVGKSLTCFKAKLN